MVYMGLVKVLGSHQSNFIKKKYWSITALQHCSSFCWTATRISHMHTGVCLFLSLLACIPSPHSPVHPSRSSPSTELGSLCYTAAPHQLPVYTRRCVCQCCSQSVPPSPSPAAATSPLSMSVSLFLPCR